MKATTGVSKCFGAPRTAARMPLAKKPERSATPAPSITISTKPSGWKWVNVAGISTNRRWRLAGERRLAAETMTGEPSSLTWVGWTAETPKAAAAAETAIRKKIR